MNAVPALQWLAVGLLLFYVNSILGVTLVSLNEERKLTVVAGLALVLNLGLNLVLIPIYQHVGAAATTAATEGFILVYLLVVMPRDLLARCTLGVLAKAGIASAAMALVLIAYCAGRALACSYRSVRQFMPRRACAAPGAAGRFPPR